MWPIVDMAGQLVVAGVLFSFDDHDGQGRSFQSQESSEMQQSMLVLLHDQLQAAHSLSVAAAAGDGAADLPDPEPMDIDQIEEQMSGSVIGAEASADVCSDWQQNGAGDVASAGRVDEDPETAAASVISDGEAEEEGKRLVKEVCVLRLRLRSARQQLKAMHHLLTEKDADIQMLMKEAKGAKRVLKKYSKKVQAIQQMLQ